MDVRTCPGKRHFPETGEDVKMMGYRCDRELVLTIALASVDYFLPNPKTYFGRKQEIEIALTEFLAREQQAVQRITVTINSLDDPTRGEDGMYLTVLGTSAEGGDSGEVGRGNKVNGVAALNGSGTGATLKGILAYTANTAGNYNYSLRAPNYTFGGPATLNSLTAMEGNVEDCNVEMDQSGAYIVSAFVKARWKTVPLALNYPRFLWMSEGQPVFEPMAQSYARGKPGNVNGYKGLATKLIDGTIPGQCLFGKFSDMLIAHWGGVDMVLHPYSLGDSYQIRVVIHVLIDIGFWYALSFCAITDAGNQ